MRRMKEALYSKTINRITGSIVAKQLALISLVSVLVVATLLFNLFFVRRANEKFALIVDTTLVEITQNNEVSRKLHRAFSQVKLILHDFLGEEIEWREQEKQLLANLRASIRNEEEGDERFQSHMQMYLESLYPLLEKCETMNKDFVKLVMLEEEIRNVLLQLDQFIIDKQLGVKKNSEEEKIAFNQFAITVPTLMEIFYETKFKARETISNILHSKSHNRHRREQIFRLIGEMRLGLEAITISWTTVQDISDNLKNKLKRYDETWENFYLSMDKFITLQNVLNRKEDKVLLELAELNKQVSLHAATLRDETQKRIKLNFTISLLISTFIILLLTAIIIIIYNVISPIKALMTGVQKVAGGDMDSKVAVRSHDEIGRLADAFNRMTEAIRETTMSRDIVENMINSLNELLIVTDLEGDITSANAATYDTLGFGKNSLRGMSIIDLLNLRDIKLEDGVAITDAKDFLEATRSGNLQNMEADYSTNSKQEVPILFSATLMRGKGGQPDGIVCIATDISERIIAEKRLIENERKYRELFENDKTALFVIDSTTKRFEDVNRAALKLFGYSKEEFLNLNIFDISAEKESTEKGFDEIIAAKNERIIIPERIFIKSDGTRFIGEISPFTFDSDGRLKVVGAVRDLSEKMHMEKQLRQSQKMEAIGTLAGGIAHDFNNILGAIIGYTELALDSCPPDTEISEDLETVLGASHRAKDLVKQILAFSRQVDTERIAIEPTTIVKEIVRLLRSTIPATIQISTDIDNSPGLILANPTQIHQILMNLCTNSYHAMEKTGGRLEIRLKKKNIEPKDLIQNSSLASGDYVQFSVCDTGPGIPIAIQDKIFDPFFTTKEPNKGTGMGLSVAHGLVQSHDGFISLESDPVAGTEVHVFLPLTDEDSLMTKGDSLDKLSGSERILFVDDEYILGKMEKTMLEKLGYKVTVKTKSIEAYETFKNHPDRFDIVITDQTMPDMTGIELSRRILKVKRDVPIILCTGYSELVSQSQVQEIGIRKLVNKPLSRNDLARIIRSSLDFDREV